MQRLNMNLAATDYAWALPCRCLIEWDVNRERQKVIPESWFSRGPAVRYNRWLVGNVGLPFGASEP